MNSVNLNDSTVEELVARRDAAAEAYYEGEPIMEDAEFDILDLQLSQMEVEDEVGHGYVPKGNTIKHEYQRLSLKKVRSMDEIDKWQEKYTLKSYVIQPKYDGQALDITYGPNGEFVQAATRGDGNVGENVSRTVESMIAKGIIPARVNTAAKNTHVVGEIIMYEDALISLNASQNDRVYANARNAAAGLLRRKSVDLSRFLSFVAYDTNHYENDEVETLHELGFMTPKSHFIKTVTKLEDIEKCISELEILNKTFGFDTDGVVIKLATTRANRERIGNSTSAPRWAVAFKFANVTQTTIIREVQWNVTRNGRLVPVAKFDGRTLSGSFVEKATLHNYSQFMSHDLHEGDTIEVTRSNEVIPFVVGKVGESAKDAKKFEAPVSYGGHPVRFNATGKDLLISDQAVADINASIVYSLKCLDAKGISTSIVQKLLDANKIEGFLDLLNVTKADVLSLEGTGDKTADAFLEIIEKLYSQPLWRWIAAMGMSFIAKNKSPILETYYATLDELSEATENELLALEGFGEEKAKSVLQSSALIKTWAQRLRDEHNFVPAPEKVEEIVASKGKVDFNGKKVVVTGTFTGMKRPDIEAWLKAHGAKVSSAVSSTTDILIAGENAGSKLAKAEALGKTIMSGSDFEEQV